MSEIELELVYKLKQINDDKDFILGVLTKAETDKNYRIILDYTDNGEEVDEETVKVLSVYLMNGQYEDWLRVD